MIRWRYLTAALNAPARAQRKGETAPPQVAMPPDSANASPHRGHRGGASGGTPINVEIFVDPGAVNVQAQKQGYSSEKRTVAVAIGETKGVEITLEVSSTTSGPNGDSGAQVDSKGMPPKTIALIAGGALTAISLQASALAVTYFRMNRCGIERSLMT